MCLCSASSCVVGSLCGHTPHTAQCLYMVSVVTLHILLSVCTWSLWSHSRYCSVSVHGLCGHTPDTAHCVYMVSVVALQILFTVCTWSLWSHSRYCSVSVHGLCINNLLNACMLLRRFWQLFQFLWCVIVLPQNIILFGDTLTSLRT